MTGGGEPARAGRPIAMLVHAYYDEDPRVRRQAETLVASGRDVDVIGLRRPGDAPTSTLAGVTVHRLDVQRHQGASLGTYGREYVSFFLRAAWQLMRRYRRRRYALVVVHTPPDALVFATTPLRLLGVPVLLDLHEAMPEFFRSRFPGAARPLIQRVLRLQERLSVRFATAAITVNDALRSRLIRSGVRPARITVVRNSVSIRRFARTELAERPFAEDGIVRLVYTGALTPIYELDVVLDGLARLRSDRPELRVTLELYGRGDSEDALRAQAERLGLTACVTFHGRIPIDDVPAAVSRADIGIAPTKRDPFTDMSLSTKIFEYAAMGKPVVASRLPMVEETFPAESIRCYEPGDAASFAAAISALESDADGRRQLVESAAAFVADVSWEKEAIGYLDLVEQLARDGSGRGQAA